MERRPTRRSELTERQREVLALIAAGKTNGEIADALGISLDGAKYHVREIMGRLGVDSREEAAAWWRSHRGSPLPLPSLRRAFVGPLWAWLGGGAAALAVAAGAIVIAAVTGGHGQAADSRTALDGTPAGVPWTLSTAGPATAGFAPTANATADPSLPAQDPSWVLANGTPVDFDICRSITDWTHPAFDEMIGPPGSYARVRLTGGRNAFPAAYYALFLSRFFYNTFATASSAQIEPSILLGLGHVGPGATVSPGDCSAWDNRWGANTLELDAEGYTFVDLRRNGMQLVALVTASPGKVYTAAFEAPVPGSGLPQKTGDNGMRAYTEIDVVSDSGVLLYQTSEPFDAVQYSDDGALVVAMLPQHNPAKTVHIYRSGDYRLYNDPTANTGSYTADFTIHQVGSSVERHISVHAPDHPWAPVAEITLDPGDYEISVSGGAGDYLMLPADTPTPVVP